ncbi:MAG: 1,2-phenylacetyl-CoA epoxidase subunit PaaC [Stappiaceae bacterium]
MQSDHFTYVQRIADDQLVLGQRLAEWCGHAPNVEIDLMLANLGLDLLGQARALYSHAAVLEGKGRDEDQIAFLRTEREYGNLLLLEQDNGDFAKTIVRQFFYAAFMLPFWQKMSTSSDEELAAIAAKAVKEMDYHDQHSAEWLVRLGDGTEESHARAQNALEELWPFCGEMFEMDEIASSLLEQGIAVDSAPLKSTWQRRVADIVDQACLALPQSAFAHSGGRAGVHTEHMGHLLIDLQYMQRTYPGMSW